MKLKLNIILGLVLILISILILRIFLSKKEINEKFEVVTENKTNLNTINNLNKFLNKEIEEIKPENKEEKSGKTVKINLKLDPGMLDQLLNRIGIDNNNEINVNQNSNENVYGVINNTSCNMDNWIPKDAVKSLCRGCDPELI
jgi:alanine racemase